MPAKVAAARTRPTADSVPGFLKGIEDPAQRADCEALSALMSKITGEEPRLWGSSSGARPAGIVGFGDVYCQGSGGRVSHAPLLGFAPRKCAISVYLVDGIHRHEADLAALGPHDTGKGCLYLWNLAGVDVKVLRRILTASMKNSRRMFDDKPPA